MNNRKSSGYYLTCAILWTVISAIATVVLWMSDATPIVMLSGVTLILMCVICQWLRYRKMK